MIKFITWPIKLVFSLYKEYFAILLSPAVVQENIWIYGLVGIPLLFLLIKRGWGQSFTHGDMFFLVMASSWEP